jgi:hypothetical protein
MRTSAFARCATGSAALGFLAVVGWAVGGGPEVPLGHWLRGWPSYGHDAQHTALSPAPAQHLLQIKWQMPVDLQPQFVGNGLYAHYATPLITARNNVLVTVKLNPWDVFRVEAHRSSDGALLWLQNTDYSLPQFQWLPPCQPTLTPLNALVIPAAGGTVLVRQNADSALPSARRSAFYGIANYDAAKATYDSMVKINTPISCDSHGNLYFGFVVLGPTPLNLETGFARISNTGAGTWVSAEDASGDPNVLQVPDGCAAAISLDGSVVYVTVLDYSSHGYLLGLNSTTLATLYKVRLKDPHNGGFATLDTQSPTVGPDGEVYCGVMESSVGSNHFRGWMLHYNSTLTQTLIPGAYGWDTTPSIVPASAVPSYGGSSPYLLLTNYNNIAGSGNGENKVAILDPHASMPDPWNGTAVMKEILTQLGPTPDPAHTGPGSPNAVHPWSINTAAIDAVTKCAIVNSEDGKCYRWDFATNTLIEPMTLNAGIVGACTPTAIGPDGKSYVISKAILYALGQ